MHFAHRVLFSLGANEVRRVYEIPDPTTEAEFNALDVVSPSPITWEQYCAKYDEIRLRTITRQLRGERSRRLARTDWIMTVDNAETLANKGEWSAYRQALRDLPSNPPTTIVWTESGDIDFTQTPMPVEPPIIRITPEASQQSSESTPSTLPTPPTPSESAPPESQPEPQPQSSSEYAPAPAAPEA
jgi:hypothetical protein